MSLQDILNRMTPEERRNEGIGALWDAIDVVLECKEAVLPTWVREELVHAQTKAMIGIPHLRGAFMERKRAGL